VQQGAYKIVDVSTGETVVDSVTEGTVYRVQLDAGLSRIKLYKQTKPGETPAGQGTGVTAVQGWEDKGVFKGPLQIVCLGNDRGGTEDLHLSRFQCESRSYRGQLEIRLNTDGSGLTGINELLMEDYLAGVVPREMSAWWPKEALKAQAIISRTYAAQNMSKHRAEGFNLCATTNCQVYGGYDYEEPAVNRLIKETEGQVLVDNQGALVTALYHSNSGGYTEDNVNVFGADLYYLRGRPDPYSLGRGLADWSYTTAVNGQSSRGEEGLRNRLLTVNPQLGLIESIELSKYPSGRVNQVIIYDDRGNNTKITGSKFVSLLNPTGAVGNDKVMGRLFDLDTDASFTMLNGQGEKATRQGADSSLTVVTKNGKQNLAGMGSSYYVTGAAGKYQRSKIPTVIYIQGHGWGHGVGLSQWGAYGMAEQGFKCEEILDFYYPGTRLTQVNKSG
jgi:stage II sporulation protein D